MGVNRGKLDGRWTGARLRSKPSCSGRLRSSQRLRILCTLLLVLCFSEIARGAGPTSGPYEQSKIHRREGSAPPTTQRGAGGTSTSSQSPWDMGKVPLALGGVLALIFAMRWLGKKMVPGARRGTSRAVQVLVQSPLSARQQLMLVQVGRRLVLVGNSGSGMSALCPIKNPCEVSEGF